MRTILERELCFQEIAFLILTDFLKPGAFKKGAFLGPQNRVPLAWFGPFFRHWPGLASFGLFWLPFGLTWALLDLPWGSLGFLWVHWASLELPLGLTWVSFGLPVATLGSLGPPFGAPWAAFGLSWSLFGLLGIPAVPGSGNSRIPVSGIPGSGIPAVPG